MRAGVRGASDLTRARVDAMAPPDAPIAVDDKVALHIPREMVHLFRAQDGGRVEV